MGTEMMKKYTRTNLFVVDRALWAWAKYRSESLGFESSSEYIFKLIQLDKEQDLIKKADEE